MKTTRPKSKATASSSPSTQTLQGTVLRLVFHNPENGYCVLKLNDGTSVVGAAPAIREGDEYIFRGEWVNSARYGQQFKFTEAELQLPTGATGLALYLSRVTAGVGIVKATRIIEALGENCLETIRSNPAILDELPFLNETQRHEIAQDLVGNEAHAQLAAMVCKHGIGMGTVARIYNHYGRDSVRVVKENPYVLCDDLWGIGYRKADAIAKTVGIADNNPFRVEAALMYTLREATVDGHCYLRPRDIVRKLIGDGGLLVNSGVVLDDVKEANTRLIQQGKCKRDGNAIYALNYYLAECTVAHKVAAMVESKAVEAQDVSRLIDEVEAKQGMVCAPEQRVGIATALNKPLSILTGGPGTGKTFTINAIVSIYETLFPRRTVYLAAPTGRAAKRISESTGKDAKTIHRLLAYSPSVNGFTHNANNPLEGPGLLVIDESSMMDVELAASVFDAATNLQVVLVGDIDQLPSVGAGSVLRDLIECGKVPTTRLNFNYRQAGGSQIAARANAVTRGEDLDLTDQGDFEHVAVEGADEAAQVVLSLAKQAVKAGLPLLDWQVLVPMRRGSCGVNAINAAVRDAINPAQDGRAEFGIWREGDKVMVVKNNYSLEVFNGDMGVITSINGGKVEVDCGDKKVLFGGEDLDTLTHAYASTVHKSQGSQFLLVIMALTTQHYIMLQRNLLYTGMTRARERLVLVADEKAPRIAVDNNKIEERFSMLSGRIKDIVGGG